jgi:hypothetical protein
MRLSDFKSIDQSNHLLGEAQHAGNPAYDYERSKRNAQVKEILSSIKLPEPEHKMSRQQVKQLKRHSI